MANFVVHLAQLTVPVDEFDSPALELMLKRKVDEKPRPPQINWDDPTSGAPLGGTKVHATDCREVPDGWCRPGGGARFAPP